MIVMVIVEEVKVIVEMVQEVKWRMRCTTGAAEPL